MEGSKGKYFLLIAAAAIAYAWLAGPAVKESQVIEIRNGRLRGQVLESRDGSEYYSFQGIPFAKAPVGELRFETPRKALNWDGVRDATKLGQSCLQPNIFGGADGDEDCLFLNVYTPELPIDTNVSLPVMVFFHGGIYTFGSGAEYGPDYFMDEDVLLVTVNYRLLSLGFLNTGDGIVKGNMGLKDQNMALRWVQENIDKFGGDPERVTIFGQSAGGASTHLHVISPMSKGLFRGAIAQSGTALSPWNIRSNPGDQAARFAKVLGCPAEDTKAMVQCMKKMNARDIVVKHAGEVMEPMRDMIKIFVPTVESGPVNEDTFLPEHPRKMLKNGQVSPVPIILGCNSEDGIIGIRDIIQTPSVKNATFSDFTIHMADQLMTKPVKSAAEKIVKRYLTIPLSAQNPVSITKMSELFTNRWYTNSIQESTLLHGKANASVFLYIYSHRQVTRVANLHLKVRDGVWAVLDVLGHLVQKYYFKVFGGDFPFYGVCHIDELLLQFKLPFLPYVGDSHPDVEVSKELVKLWADFARGGSIVTSNGVAWEPVNTNFLPEVRFLNISRKPQMVENPYHETYKFWESLGLEPNL